MRISFDRLRGRCALPACALMLAGSLLLSAAASAQATQVPAKTKTTSCKSSLSKVYFSLGVTYVVRLNVAHVTCGSAEKFIKSYNACREKSGGFAGKCPKLDGFKCKEQRETGEAGFTALATCTKSREIVDFAYTADKP